MDRIAPGFIARWILPHQRLLALAAAARGDKARFGDSLGFDVRLPLRLESALRDRAARQDRHAEAHARWTEAFFDRASPGASGDEELVLLEQQRRSAARATISGGAAFLGILPNKKTLAWDIPPPAAVPAPRLSPACGLEDGAAAVQLSRTVKSVYGRESWIRFPSPAMGDRVWARVYEPGDRDIRGTIVVLHGIAMETEFWRDLADPINGLTQAGFRVIRPEGPWHGRRRLTGCFGGEPALARAPLGLIELIEGWSEEVRVITAWCRARHGGPVALAGLSLGALAGQWMAVAARSWQAAERPNLLFLMVTSGDVVALATRSSLARALGIPRRIEGAGWDEAALARLSARIAPTEAPVMDPGRVVMLLGRHDDLTPFEGGLALARRWALPPENLFAWPYGHFSAPLRLSRDPAPLRRLVALFDGL